MSSNAKTRRGSLAQSHRPRSFDAVIGQHHVTTVLRKALNAGRLPSQVLFAGPSGVGKTTLARVVAAALLCETPNDGDPCGSCDSCLDVFEPSRTHPDLVEFDAASHGLKDQVRELATRAATMPVRGEHRVYIIDEAHGLSAAGGQAFLKLLEEPPPHVVFLLATTDPDKMLETNRGRCLTFDCRRPSDEQIASQLQRVAAAEGLTLTDRTAAAVVAATDPALGVRGAIMSFEKIVDLLEWSDEPSPDELSAVLGAAPSSRVDEILEAVDAGDRRGALEMLQRCSQAYSDQAVRRALLARLRRRLHASAADSSSESFQMALWRLDSVASSPAGALWTELAVARLASPRLDPSPDLLAAQLEEASIKIGELQKLLATAGSVTEQTSTSPPDGSVVVEDEMVAAKEEALSDEIVEGFVSALESNRRAKALVNSPGVSVEVTDDKVTLTAPAALARLLNAEAETLEHAAQPRTLHIVTL